MKMLLKRLATKLRVSLYPTVHDKEVARFFKDYNSGKFMFEYDLDDKSLVFDLGGYKGQWASDIYSRYNCRILIFEPVKIFADEIANRFSNNPKLEIYCLALGKTHRQEIISVSNDGTSIYGTSLEKEAIQFEDAAVFLSKQEIDKIDLMKINIEGGEYELLPRLIETGYIAKIKQIKIQFHNVEQNSETQMNQISQELNKTHRLMYRYKFVWENWVRLD